MGFEALICTSHFMFSEETHSCCQVNLASVRGRAMFGISNRVKWDRGRELLLFSRILNPLIFITFRPILYLFKTLFGITENL